MEEEGAGTHPDSLSEPKTDAHVHGCYAKDISVWNFFYFIFFREVLSKTLII